MIYVALLRGINVGGKSKVPMVDLKAIFEAAGCTDVLTYINSGNVIFSDSRSSTELAKIIETGIENKFGFNVPVVIRDQTNIAKLCQQIPDKWTNDALLKTDVIFLWDNIADPSILKQIKYKPEIEEVRYIEGSLVWHLEKKHVTRGSMIKLIGTDSYRYMTIRNINTVRKLNSLMGN